MLTCGKRFRDENRIKDLETRKVKLFPRAWPSLHREQFVFVLRVQAPAESDCFLFDVHFSENKGPWRRGMVHELEARIPY